MNELQTILSESVNRLFTDRLSWDAQTRIEDEGWPAALWNEVVEQGLHKVLAAEAEGGMNGIWADAYVVARACGRHAVPLPVVEAMLAEWLARRAGIALPAGVPGLLDFPLAPAALAGGRITLQDARVPWGHVADYLIGVSAAGELIIASAAGADIRQSLSNDGLARVARVGWAE